MLSVVRLHVIHSEYQTNDVLWRHSFEPSRDKRPECRSLRHGEAIIMARVIAPSLLNPASSTGVTGNYRVFATVVEKGAELIGSPKGTFCVSRMQEQHSTGIIAAIIESGNGFYGLRSTCSPGATPLSSPHRHSVLFFLIETTLSAYTWKHSEIFI